MVTKACFTNFAHRKAKIPYNPRDFMILNKFSPFSLFRVFKSFGIQLLVLSLFSCSKTANSTENKAYVGVTNVAYGIGPVNITLDGDSLLPAPLPFGSTSGTPSYPYDTAVSRVSQMELVQGNQIVMQGNSAFQQGTFYSIFVFDSLNKDSAAVGMLILQNNPYVKSDTTCTFRFMNFSPGSALGIVLIYVHDTTFHDTIHIHTRDTVRIGLSNFVGRNPNPAAYTISFSAHTGLNQVLAYTDSANGNARPDSSNYRRLGNLMFNSPSSYNVYLQNYFFPGPLQDSLQIVSFPMN